MIILICLSAAQLALCPLRRCVAAFRQNIEPQKQATRSNSTLRLQYIIHYAYPRCEIPAQLNFQGRALFNKCFPEVTGTQFNISFKGIQKLIVAA